MTEVDVRKWFEEEQVRVEDMRQREGYAGLSAPFRGIAERLSSDFRTSTAIKHRGDKGTARENLLKQFLTKDGYLPARYALAENSSHVISSSGHQSQQIDLLFFDALNAPRLLSVGGIQYFPIESCFGMIEAKSDLNSRERVFEGLDNIAAFKRLRVRPDRKLVGSDAFGVLFGYTASLKWPTVFDAVREWEAQHEPSTWPNLIVVLDQGAIAHHRERRLALHTSHIAQDGELFPVALGPTSLLSFYLLLLDLLAEISLPRAPLQAYVALPKTVGAHSYSFGPLMPESGRCSVHGDYLRSMSEAAIDRILTTCVAGSEIDPIAALADQSGHLIKRRPTVQSRRSAALRRSRPPHGAAP